MKAIFRKEWKGFMTSMVGCVFIAFLLVVSGIYFTAYHLQGAYPVFSYTLEAVLFVFLIGVPILTMRILAEERKQKTDQLLFTAPVSVTEVVCGKYFALVAVFLVPVLVLACYPLILSQFGTIHYMETYTAMFGFFLLGCSFLAIGLYLSSVTESQVIAAVLTFLLLFVCYVIQGISTFFPKTADGSFYALVILAAAFVILVHQMIGKVWITVFTAAITEGALFVIYLLNGEVYAGVIQKIFDVFDLTGHFTNLSSGMLNLADIIYYLSVIGVFLFLTVQSIQKRRWGTSADRKRFKYGAYSIAMTGIVAAAAVVLNLVISEIPSQYTEFDVSSNQLSIVGTQTKELLKELKEDITIYYIVQDGKEDIYVERLLQRYEDLSSHVTVVKKDPVQYPKFISQYTDDSISENSVIIECGTRNRIVTYEEMYEQEFDYTYYTYETTGFDAEGQLTSAIAAVSSDNFPKIYVMNGHGETELSETYLAAIGKANIETESLNLITAEQVPEDADCVLLAAPTADISAEEAEKLLTYLKSGGRTMVLVDYTGKEMPNLKSVLSYYGTELVDGIVMEDDNNYYIQIPYYLVPDINSSAVSSDLTGGAAYVLLPAAQGLVKAEDIRDGVTVTSVLSTSDQAYVKQNVETIQTYGKEENDVEGPFELGIIVTEKVTKPEKKETGDTGSETITESEEVNESITEEESETKLAVYSCSALLDEAASQMVSGGNETLFMNTVSWLCGQSTSVSVPVKSLSMDHLTVTAASGNFWSILVIAVIPGVFLIYGFLVWIRRRKQ